MTNKERCALGLIEAIHKTVLPSSVDKTLQDLGIREGEDSSRQ